MVILSDGKDAEVRQLRFLELEDNVPYEVDPSYVYAYEVAGGTQEQSYTLSDWDEVPEKPKEPFGNAQPDTELYALWETYNLYQAVLLHEQKRAEQIRQYLVNCARYILKSCVTAAVRKRVVSPVDYETICAAALCPEVTKEDLEAELASTFQGFIQWPANPYGDVEGAGRRGFLSQYSSMGGSADDSVGQDGGGVREDLVA